MAKPLTDLSVITDIATAPILASPPVIAIDGPAASGKGTIARKLAAHFGFAHLDTGALYRAVGLLCLRSLHDPQDDVQATAAAQKLSANMDILQDPELRSNKAGVAASQVAAISGVRTALLQFQRDFAAGRNKPDTLHGPGAVFGAVLDGRDIGTVICPKAPVKLFITAALEVRTARRVRELELLGHKVDPEKILHDMRERDKRDSERAVAPLVAAQDALTIDSTALTAEEVLQTALAYAEPRLLFWLKVNKSHNY